MPTITKELIWSCIPKSRGYDARVCRLAGISYSGFRNFLNSNNLMEEYKEAQKNYRDELIAKAEDKLAELVEAGEMDAIKFTLLQKGRDHGYVEKQQVEHTGAIPTINIQIVKTEQDQPIINITKTPEQLPDGSTSTDTKE